MQTKSAHNGNNIESRTIRGIRIAHEARTKSETRIPHGQWPSPPVAGPSGAGTVEHIPEKVLLANALLPIPRALRATALLLPMRRQPPRRCPRQALHPPPVG